MKKHQSDEKDLNDHSELKSEETPRTIYLTLPRNQDKLKHPDETKNPKVKSKLTPPDPMLPIPSHSWVSHLRNKLRAIVEDDNQYINPLLEDNMLDDLLFRLDKSKREVADEQKTGRLHRFNEVLRELGEEVTLKKARKMDLVKQMKEFSIEEKI